MVKKRNKKMKRKRRLPIRRNRRGLPTSPPLYPFNRTLSNAVIRSSFEKDFSNGIMNVIDFSTQDVIHSWTKLTTVYKEIKVGKVIIWMTPYASTNKDGMIATIVAPKDEVDAKLTWTSFISTPGSIVRKLYQTTHGIYFPTEPSEKDWFPTTLKDRKLFVVCVMVNGITTDPSNVTPSKYLIVCDAHVTFRGKAVTSSTERTISLDDFEHLMN